MSDAFDKGMAVRRRTLGDAHVDAAGKTTTDLDAGFQDMITETAWGRVWAGDHWTPRERSVVTLALLASQGHWDEFAMHLRATTNTGASAEDIRETLMHVAIYAGVPAANKGFKIAKDVLAEMASDA